MLNDLAGAGQIYIACGHADLRNGIGGLIFFTCFHYFSKFFRTDGDRFFTNNMFSGCHCFDGWHSGTKVLLPTEPDGDMVCNVWFGDIRFMGHPVHRTCYGYSGILLGGKALSLIHI